MNIKIKPLYKSWVYFSLILAALSTAVIINSYFDENGYLSPDSTYYLRLAQNLSDGKGYMIAGNYITDFTQTKENGLFSVFPIGYPTLIFIISKFSNTGTFWASKILNIVLLLSSMLFIKKLFGNNHILYNSIFLAGSYLYIFSFTWSEAPFIFGLIWFCASIYYVVSKQNTLIWALNLFFSSTFLFLNRYIGAFSIVALFLLSCFLIIKKERKTALILLITSTAVALITFIYLYNNYLHTGFLTGMKRLPAPETNLELTLKLLESIIVELNIIRHNFFNKNLFFATLVFQAIVFALFWIKNKTNFKLKTEITDNRLWKIFAIVGLTYLISVIVLRFSSLFDDFDFRLMSPATLLLIISLFNFIQTRCGTLFFNNLRRYLIFLFVFAFLFNFSTKLFGYFRQQTPSYNQTIKNIEDKYNEVPKNSIVIFPELPIYYLRTDIIVVFPKFKPFSNDKETINDLVKRIVYKSNQFIFFNNPKTNELKKINLKIIPTKI